MSKTILITGASSGIGRATAHRFHDEDWNVVATMRDPDDAGDLVGLDNVLVTRLDVTDTESIDEAVAAAVDRFGSVEALLNNAGFGAYGPLEATPMETIRRQFDTNVIGLMATTKALLPPLRAARAGVVINMSSMGGVVAFPLGTLYHGSKFAVEGLSEALSYELAQFGVRVKIIEPGTVATDFGGRSFVFSNDESLTEYQPAVQKLLAATTSADPSAQGDSSGVAEVVYTAATDGTDQLRYVYGDDASQVIAGRRVADDTTFMGGIATQFGL